MDWGGSGIEKEVFDFILSVVPKGETIIELGAGNVSTRELSKHYNLISVEHNIDWVGLHPKANYIHAPLKGNWYDTAPLQDLPPQKLVLIDGLNRKGILNNLDLFSKDAIFLIHDTWRKEERDLAYELAEMLERDKLTFYMNGDYYAVI